MHVEINWQNLKINWFFSNRKDIRIHKILDARHDLSWLVRTHVPYSSHFCFGSRLSTKIVFFSSFFSPCQRIFVYLKYKSVSVYAIVLTLFHTLCVQQFKFMSSWENMYECECFIILSFGSLLLLLLLLLLTATDAAAVQFSNDSEILKLNHI